MNQRSALFTAGMLILLCALPAVDAMAQRYDARTEYWCGYSPRGLVVGDLNNDGHRDLAMGSCISPDCGVSVLLGRADGFIEEARFSAGEGRLGALAIGDLNLDGNLDLVGISGESYEFDAYVFRGNGDGTFLEPLTWDVGAAVPSALALGDVDGNGSPDLVVALGGRDQVSVLLNDNGSDLLPPVLHDVAGSPVSVVLDDFNNDGNLDIATANKETDNVSVLLGYGNGTFTASVAYPAGTGPVQIATGDLDGDGATDLVVATGDTYSSPTEFSVVMLPGTGDGTFEPPVMLDTDINPGRVTLGDLDGDGHQDLVVLIGVNDYYLHRDAAAVFFGQGDFTFQAAGEYVTGQKPRSLIVEDFDDDGCPDLAVLNGNSGTVSTYANLGDGTFAVAYEITTTMYSTSPLLGDLDGDGHQDLVVLHSFDDLVSVRAGRGDGTFGPAVDYPVGDRPRSASIGHLDNDEFLDVAVVNWFGDSVSILLGNGDGTFAVPIDIPVGDAPKEIVIGDLDGDGINDLAVTRESYHSVQVGLGNGDGTFRAGGTYVAGNRPEYLVAGDLNGDGILDLAVVASGYPRRITVMLGNGDGSFQAGTEYTTEYYPGPIFIGDLDGDTIPDMVVLGYGTPTPDIGYGSVEVFRGNGDGTFPPAQSHPYPFFVFGPSLIDFDTDGTLDLMGTIRDGNTACMLPGNGDGTFGATRLFGVGIEANDLAVGDLNGTGVPDLVTTDYGSISVVTDSWDTVTATLSCVPSFGTLPFSSLFQASMTNNYAGLTRRFQYTINVTLAGGQFYSNWRRGWQNIQAGEMFTKQWVQTIPDLPSLEGVNHFQMTVADVTPPPYNLPPYPPAGDTDRDNCTVTGVAP